MSAIARDGVASDHLVYAWPFPLGPECDVTCRDDEQVVMCPAWAVGDRLGPGHHRWRSPDPTKPVAAYFVLLAPVEIGFDCTTSFMIPTTGQPVRLRTNGSLQVRCTDPGLLIAQFVGLPFDSINEGITRSVSRSVERMIMRLLTRRVVMAGTPQAVTDPAMKPQIVEELVAYNPAAGAVFGIEMLRVGHITIAADDGSSPYFLRPAAVASGSQPPIPTLGGSNGNGRARAEDQTINTAMRGSSPPGGHGGVIVPRRTSVPPLMGEEHTGPNAPAFPSSASSSSGATASGEIGGKRKTPAMGMEPLPRPKTDSSGGAQMATSSGEIIAKPSTPRRAAPIEVPQPEEITSPAAIPTTPVPGSGIAPPAQPSRGAIMGIGMSAIGSSGVSGEIPQKIKPGGRVLVPGPNGLMQSATVRQLLQGYYELEVGSSGETIWVPINGVVPDP